MYITIGAWTRVGFNALFIHTWGPPTVPSTNILDYDLCDKTEYTLKKQEKQHKTNKFTRVKSTSSTVHTTLLSMCRLRHMSTVFETLASASTPTTSLTTSS